MDWWTKLGNMAALFQAAPALAPDLALNGPRVDNFAYHMAYAANATATDLEVYPQPGIAFPTAEDEQEPAPEGAPEGGEF